MDCWFRRKRGFRNVHFFTPLIIAYSTSSVSTSSKSPPTFQKASQGVASMDCRTRRQRIEGAQRLAQRLHLLTTAQESVFELRNMSEVARASRRRNFCERSTTCRNFVRLSLVHMEHMTLLPKECQQSVIKANLPWALALCL